LNGFEANLQKVIKEKRKQKKKNKEQKKVKEGRGKLNGPKPVSALAQHRRVPNRYAAQPSHPADMWDPHVRVTIYLWAEPLSLTACPGAL
jgi:hypothetical protein